MKKKIAFIIIGYLVTICAVIGVFAFVFSNQLKDNVVECYIATQDIEVGTTWNNVIAKTTEKTETTKEYQDNLTSKKVVLVTDLKTLNNLKVVKTISKGTIITREYFSVNTPSETKLEEEYEMPTYVPLTVEPNSILSKEVIKGQKMAILANVPLTDLENLENDVLVDENLSKGNVLMSISNHAEVFKIEKDANNNIATITFITSYNEAVKLLSIKEKAKIYFVDNDIITEGTDVFIKNDLAIVDYNALKQMFASSGYVSSQLSEFSSYLQLETTTKAGEVSTTTYDQIKFNPNYYSDIIGKPGYSYVEQLEETIKGTDKEGNETLETIYYNSEIDFSGKTPNTLIEVEATNKKVELKWTSYCPIIYINHYTFNGELNPIGGLGGKYSLSNNEFLYNDKTETYSLKQELDQDGYYEVKFYDKDYEIIGKYCFSVEKTKQWGTNDNGKYTKNYYLNIEPLRDYYQTASEDYEISGAEYKATMKILETNENEQKWVGEPVVIKENEVFDLSKKDGIKIYSLAINQSLIYSFPYYSACHVTYYDMAGQLFTGTYSINNENNNAINVSIDKNGNASHYIEFKSEGYYEITLLENDNLTTKTVKFIIETQEHKAINSDNNEYATKEYFQVIKPLNNYKISAVSTETEQKSEPEAPAEE